MSENSENDFQEHKGTSSHCLSCQTNSVKLKNIQLTMTNDREQQEILILEQLAPMNVWHFFD